MSKRPEAEDGKRPAERLNFVDRVVTFFNPLYGCRAMAARQHLHQFGYNDHKERRGKSGGQSKNAGSETYANGRDVLEAMWDARNMARFTWIGGTLGKIVLYVLGQLETKSNTGDPELDTLYDDYFHGWCGDVETDDGRIRCDFSGRFRLIEKLQMAFLAELVDGDQGFVWRDEPIEGSDNPELMLQSVEADRIGSPIEATQAENYVRGFTIDPGSGRVVSIRIYRRTRQQQYVDPVPVEPFNFIHCWDPKRSDQYRGVSALMPILNDLRDLHEWDEAEMIAGKTQSQWAAIMATKDLYSDKGADAWDNKTKEGTPTQEAQWGKILRAGAGESVSMLAPPSRPSAAFQSFAANKIRKVMLALGFSFEFGWDMSGLGGVTARVSIRSDERRVLSFQRRYGNIVRRIRARKLAHGVAHGEIPAHPRMNECTCHFGPQLVTDAGYEVSNDVTMMKAGIVAWDDIATKYSGGAGTLRDIFQRNVTTIQGAQQLAGDAMVPIEAFAPELMPNVTQLLAAINTDPSEVNPPPPKPGSLEAVGEKGAAQIVDLLEKVTTGMIDRESAKATLQKVYGVPPAMAEAICPEERNGKGQSDNRTIGQSEGETP